MGGNKLHNKKKLSTPSWQSQRVPPRQPTQRNTDKENQLRQDEEQADEPSPPPIPTATTAKPKINPLLQKTKKRKIATVTPSTKSHTPSQQQQQQQQHFHGAIGNVVVPASVRAILRPHQRQGIGFLWNCLTGAATAPEARPKGCILADEMGLGKTLMTISTIFAMHRRRKDHRFIVVCPSSLVSNWGKEFDKWLGRASQPKRVVIRKGGELGLAALRAFVPLKPHQSEVLIVSYDQFRMHSSLLTHAKQIGLLVVDEGHRLKNTSGSLTLSALEALDCEARLLITGTPIQNNLSEFYNVANFVCPGLLGDLWTFRRVYERPIVASNNKNATWEQRNKGQVQSRELEQITKTFMLRRLQKDILKSLLPPRSEFLLFCRPSQLQSTLYKSITSKTSVAGASAEALTVLTNLRKLCSHPSLVLEKSSASANGSHASLSGKLMVLESLLRCIRTSCPGDKVVIVSNFTSVLSVIEESLISPNNWTFRRLDGSTDQCDRQSLVDSFNRATPEQSFLFLLSSKAGGCGLNLIGANRLVMIDADWNPASDMQAMARIYRQGQTKPCFVYRCFLSGTVEEVIYQRQYQKGNLANLTVDGGNKKASAPAKGFTKEELRDCFTLKEGCDCDTKRKIGRQWPDYSGADGLATEQDCQDDPLLAVADQQADTLAFVHVVTDAHEEVVEAEQESQATKPVSGDHGSSLSDSSEEEYEFED